MNKFSKITAVVISLLLVLSTIPVCAMADDRLDIRIEGLNHDTASTSSFDTFSTASFLKIGGGPIAVQTNGAEEECEYNGLKFALLPDGSYEVCGYTNVPNTLSIPAHVNGKPVSRIGVKAFQNCDSLGMVNIQYGITGIGESAFQSCKNLMLITIPDSVNKIGAYAFSDCITLAGVNLPQGIKKIEEATFSRCTAMQNMALPKDLEEIDFAAFSGCESIQTVLMYNKVNKIHSKAFDGCSGLKNIYYTGTASEWDGIQTESQSKTASDCFDPCPAITFNYDVDWSTSPTIIIPVTVDTNETTEIPDKSLNLQSVPNNKYLYHPGLEDILAKTIKDTYPSAKSSGLKVPSTSKFTLKNKKAKVKITLKKIKGAKKLQYRYKLKGKKKWSKAVTRANKNKTYVVKNLKKNKIYSFTIRYEKGKKWSKWSKEKKVKVK